MKKIYLITILLVGQLISYAQGVAINDSGVAADPTALVDMSTHTKGLLIPRLRTIERTAIANPAEGLLVYDTDTYSFWFAKLGAWKEILDINDVFTLPYAGTASLLGNLFSITNTNAGISTAIFGRRMGGSGIGLSTSNGIWGDNSDGNGTTGTSNTGAGVAGFSNSGIGVNATSTSGNALVATSSSGFGISATSVTNFGIAGSTGGVDKAGVLGVNTNNTGPGYGVIGSIENPTGGAAVYGKNLSPAGNAGLFTNTNNSNIDPALKVSTTGNGAAGYFTTTGLGPCGYFVHSNTANPNPGVVVSNFSNTAPGLAVWNAATNNNHGLWVAHNGTGKAVYSTSELGQAGVFKILNNTNGNASLESNTVGTGRAALFTITNTVNDVAAVEATTSGTGLAGKFVKNNTTGSISDIHDPCVLVDNTSKGAALKVSSLHAPSVNAGVDINYDGQTFGLNVLSTHGGIHASSTGTQLSILAENYSGGSAIKGVSDSWSNPGIIGENLTAGGTGVKGIGHGDTGVGVTGVGTSNNYSTGAVVGMNNSPTQGVAVYGEAIGTSGVGIYGVGNYVGVKGESLTSTGVEGYAHGNGSAGVSGIVEAAPGSFGSAVVGNNWAKGDGVRGFAGTNGAGITGFSGDNTSSYAGYFENATTNNPFDAVRIKNTGTGATLNIIETNASNGVTMVRITKSGTGDYMVLEEGDGTNEIRFDNNGKGFFNGGTQTGGADIAESFEVENAIESYEPGDVLAISLDSDRTVTKSSEPYSTLVAGVYATKPGVLMTEHSISTDLSSEVPMGVIGVIPTKVCLEGGAINRGDLLVTSSIAGVAMKGDIDKIRPGQVIGKALENYTLDQVGKIKVLVSIK